MENKWKRIGGMTWKPQLGLRKQSAWPWQEPYLCLPFSALNWKVIPFFLRCFCCFKCFCKIGEKETGVGSWDLLSVPKQCYRCQFWTWDQRAHRVLMELISFFFFFLFSFFLMIRLIAFSPTFLSNESSKNNLLNKRTNN